MTELRVLHLSDLHFGARHFFPADGESLLQPIIDDPFVRDIGLVVVSGDLTWSATQEEFGACADFVADLSKELQARVLVVPGNHDVDFADRFAGARSIPFEARQNSFRSFLTQLRKMGIDVGRTPRTREVPLSRRESLLMYQQGAGWLAVGVNTAATLGRSEDSVEYPVALSSAVFAALDNLILGRSTNEARILVCHHHLFPFVEPRWGPTAGGDSELGMKPDASLLANSGQLQAWLAANGFSLVLHGHKHVTHGRLDRVWTGREDESREVVVVGAGSAGVDSTRRPDSEPLAYNVIDIYAGNSGFRVKTNVRKIDYQQGRTRSVDGFRFTASAPSETSLRSINYFHGETSSDCHSAVAEAMSGVQLIRNFVSVFEQSTYVHPQSLTWRGEPAAPSLVESAFAALEPHLVDTSSTAGRRRTARGRDLNFQLQHSSRLFRSHLGLPRSSPFDVAVQALTTSQGARRSFVGLFRTEIDAAPFVEAPPPGLVGVQFVLDERNGRRVLHLVAVFRHLELSFWWGVNALEMSRLLQRAAHEAQLDQPPLLGSITFFASMAGWEDDPGLVAKADIDVLSTEDLTSYLARALAGNLEALALLRKMLIQKAGFTNAANVETAGLDDFRAVAAGMAGAGLAGRSKRMWEAVIAELALAVVALDAAVVGPGMARADSVERAVGHINTAALSLG